MYKLLTIFLLIISSLKAFDLELWLSTNNMSLRNDPQIFFGPIECGEYSDSEFNVITFGFTNRGKIWKDFGYYASLSYQVNNAVFSRQDVFTTRSDIDFLLEQVTKETSVKMDFTHALIGGGLSYMKEDILLGAIRFDLGLNYAIPQTRIFDQEEVIVTPDNAVFINSGFSQQRDILTGNIQTAQNFMLLDLKFTNYIKLGKLAYISQSIGYSIALNSMFSDVENNISSINFGIGLAIIKTKEETVDEPVIIPIEEKPKPKEAIEIVERQDEDEEIDQKEEIIVVKPAAPKPEVTIQVNTDWANSEIKTGEELLATLPLVNSIFFEQNSSEIIGQNNNLIENIYTGDAIDAHSAVIKRLSDIMIKNPNSKVEISGYTSGLENEPDGIKLAIDRADAVKSMLIDYGINENRISTKSFLLPPKPSNMKFQEGIAENQRADIRLIDAKTQEYVAFQNFTELNGTVEVIVDFKNIDESLKLKNSLSSEILEVNNPGTYRFKVNQRFDAEDKQVLNKTELSFLDSSIIDKEVISLESLSSINVNYDLTRFEAVLRFDYNSAKLSTENQELLKQLIELLPEHSEIQILGSADAIGSDEANEILENQRADNTRKFIEDNKSKNFTITTGRSKNKYPEDTPQGRFLNRSIRIKVKSN